MLASGAAIAADASRTAAALRQKSGSPAERLFRGAMYGAVGISGLVLVVLLVRIVTQGDGRLGIIRQGRGEDQVHAVEVLVPPGGCGPVEVVVVHRDQVADHALDATLLLHLADDRQPR